MVETIYDIHEIKVIGNGGNESEKLFKQVDRIPACRRTLHLNAQSRLLPLRRPLHYPKSILLGVLCRSGYGGRVYEAK